MLSASPVKRSRETACVEGKFEMPLSGLQAASAGVDARPLVSLLGGFSVRVAGSNLALPKHSRRVLAYLCLDKTSEDDCDRGILAERLWPDASEERSRASLRTALWRIRRASPGLVCSESDRVMLADDVRVDVHQYRRHAEQLLTDREDCPHERAQLMARNSELLPGWDETWLLLAREQLRQLRLHVLETAGRRLADRGRYPEAIDVMLMVVNEEPLRESAQAALIEAHLCEGNVIEARRQFSKFADLLWTELALRPSPELYGRVIHRQPSGQSAVRFR
jgi:DNA-binding SARP family transcriptional activator